jgi:uncharacterized membrane protein
MGKKIRFENELLLINILVWLLIFVIALFPANVLRLILGLPFMLFFPGYALVSALFPKKDTLDSLERIAFSFGLSIAVTVLAGLILHYTPWGLDLYPILLTLTGFILVTSAIAYYRRRRLPTGERFAFSFQISLPRWAELSPINRALSIVLVLTMLGAMGVLGYVIAAPRGEERFTEFYLLGPEGTTENYPRELEVGEKGIVTLGIVNHERQEVSYHVEIRINGVKNGELGQLVLAQGEERKEEVSFVPQGAGDNQRVEFLLYRSEEEEPCTTLHFFTDVNE